MERGNRSGIVRLMSSPSVLWELRGRTGKPVTCYLYPIALGTHRLTVMMGDDEIVSERFVHERDALAQARFLCDDFIAEGWTEQFQRDPRIKPL